MLAAVSAPAVAICLNSLIYVVSDIAAVTLDDEQLVTLRLSSGNYLRFQPGTGAQLVEHHSSTAVQESC